MDIAKPEPRSATTLSPLTHGQYRLIWTSSLVANFGNAVQSVGAAWLLTELRQSPSIIALVQTAASLPLMLLALPAGAIADLRDRRAIMLVAQLAMFATSVLLAILAYRHQASPWIVLALTFVLGSGIAFFNPALSASTGTLVPREELAGAAALNILAFNVARTLGPAIGGVIVVTGGSSAAFMLNAASYLAVIGVLAVWRPAPAPATARVPIHRAIVDGLSFIGRSSQVRTILIRAFTFTATGSAAWALMPLASRDLLHGGSVEFGLLLAALGIGAVIGAGSATYIRQRFSSEVITRAAGAIYGCSCLATAARPGLVPTLLLLVVAGAGWVQALSGFSVATQLWTPRPLVGRAMAIVSSVTFGGIAVGSWLWGYVASVWGVGEAIAASGGLMIIIPLIGIWLPMPRHQDADRIAMRQE
nr:MFS transporter [Polymorphobacter sp.]